MGWFAGVVFAYCTASLVVGSNVEFNWKSEWTFARVVVVPTDTSTQMQDSLIHISRTKDFPHFRAAIYPLPTAQVHRKQFRLRRGYRYLLFLLHQSQRAARLRQSSLMR